MEKINQVPQQITNITPLTPKETTTNTKNVVEKKAVSLNGANALSNYNKVILNQNKQIAFKGDSDDLDLDFDWDDIFKGLDELEQQIHALENGEVDEDAIIESGYKMESDWQETYKAINDSIKLTEVSSSQKLQLMKNFFTNNDIEIESVLKNTDFTKYEKDGIPLKYPRKQFFDDMTSLFEDEKELIKMMKKIGVTPSYDENYEIGGYNGILNYDGLDLTNDKERDLYTLVHKFIKENEVQTDDETLNRALNALIKGMPEFINIIGKQQHELQDFSLDVHTLSVLQKSMTNPEYENLSNSEKNILKWTAILHDISKAEYERDYIHYKTSSIYARKILERYKLPTSFKDRVYEQIRNHHWLAEYNNGYLTANDVAVIFRKNNDIKISRILTEADIKSIDKKGLFWQDFADALSPEMQQPIDEAIKEHNKSGQLIHASRIINYKNIPTIEHNGETYKVIDALNITDEQASKIFAPGTKKDDLRFFIHVVDDNDSAIDKLETLYTLGDLASENMVSASFVSAKNKKTICEYKFGLALDSHINNISNAHWRNQYSGTNKDISDFIKQVQADSDLTKEFKSTIPTVIKQELNLTDEEYGELYKKIAQNQHFSTLYINGQNPKSKKDILLNQQFNINGKTYTGKDVINAIKKAEDTLLEKTIYDFNEVCIYKPKTTGFIAKVNSIEDIPEQYFDFIKKHNLPIILIGE